MSPHFCSKAITIQKKLAYKYKRTKNSNGFLKSCQIRNWNKNLNTENFRKAKIS